MSGYYKIGQANGRAAFDAATAKDEEIYFFGGYLNGTAQRARIAYGTDRLADALAFEAGFKDGVKERAAELGWTTARIAPTWKIGETSPVVEV